MRRLHDLLFRLRALTWPRGLERELDDEMSFHLDMATEKLEREGLTPEEARREALRRFGSRARQKDRARWEWGISFVRDLGSDAKLVGRQMRRDPVFGFGTVVTLALGIGANTAIFSIADQALMRAPAVSHGNELIAVYTTCRRGQPRCSSSWPDYLDYRDRSTTLSDLAARSFVPLNVGSQATARLATGALVSGNYFSLLGVPPHAGRLIQPADNPTSGGASVAVLAHEFWREAFGGDPDVVGGTIRLNGAPFEVVGVVPEEFTGLSLSTAPDVYVPIFAGPALGSGVGAASDPDIASDRGSRWVQTLIGRMAPGVNHARVRADMDRLAAAMGEDHPDMRAAIDGVRGITVDRLDGYILPVGSEDELSGFVVMLMAVVAMTLLLAAANLANLQLARGTARAKEIGVRMAVGAGRARVLRQLLTESLVLSLVGGLMGLGVAAGMLSAIGAFELPGGVVISSLGVGLDIRALAFALLLSVITSALFGLVPALRTSRRELVQSVKGDSDRGLGMAPLRKALVAVQVGLCLVLLVGSGLFLRTLRNSLDHELGFEPAGLIAARFNLSLLAYDESRAQSFGEDLVASVRALPGVEAASLSTLVPFQRGGFSGTFAEIDGYEAAPDEEIRIDRVLAGPEYFESIGTRVLEGRPILRSDLEGGPPVAVINRYMAERYWAGRSPVGSTFRISPQDPIEVIGVVENPSWQAIGEAPSPFAFFPQAQSPSLSSRFFTLTARTSDDPRTLLTSVREVFRSLEPGLSLTTLQTMEDQLGAALMPQRMGSTLLTMLGGLALVLAAVGVYGVVSYTVTRRARDIGIRIAVGASGGRILRTMVTEMLIPIAAGLAIGAVAAWFLADAVEAFMFGVSPGDPVTFLTIVGLLLITGVGATLIPARAAARVDPVAVLKAD